MSFTVTCALIASMSYALFSQYYEPTVRKLSNPSHAAIILYAIAGSLLASLSVSVATLCRVQLNLQPAASFFSVTAPPSDIFSLLTIGMLSMTLLYAVHIHTEAASRRSMNMGLYAIIFQLNIAILAVADFVLFRPHVSTVNWIGSAVIFGSTVVGMFVHTYGKELTRNVPLDREVIRLALISASSCGLALLIDGEVVRNFILTQGDLLGVLATFFAYEALTFLAPCLALTLYHVAKPAHRFSARMLARQFSLAPSGFLLSGLFSAMQFVFSVLALALPGPRLIPAAVLGTAPFICVLLGQKNEPRWIAVVELLLALTVILGISLIAL